MSSQQSELDDMIKQCTSITGAMWYLLLNADGIPIKKHPSLTPEHSLHIASLSQDLWNVVRKVNISEYPLDNDLQYIRLRTEGYYEYILTQATSPEGTSAMFILTQNCSHVKADTLVKVPAEGEKAPEKN
jgi:hypothetical protein